ncbi:hypothetical protein RchiOBHm_Chr1g0382211 [Rosa chinensis]|uniref:Uncharacterized protein n=1 Tax=Rosa chinensis TaxID=74649 RepID=A0A2P6SPC0_ROSCH|nr:hypothetical protein RchiOBHm_Chr1g0382211 [Rosa chinensis]
MLSNQHLKLLLVFFRYFFCMNNTELSKLCHLEYSVAPSHNKCVLYRNVPRPKKKIMVS